MASSAFGSDNVESLCYKCRHFENLLISSATASDEVERIGYIILELFTTKSASLFLLTDTTASSISSDVRNFLSPDSLLFGKIVSLSIDTLAKIDIPLSRLPLAIQNCLSFVGPTCEFFRNHLVYLGATPCLSLSPLEAFFYCFCANLLDSDGYDPSVGYIDKIESTYTAVLQDYLNHLLGVNDEIDLASSSSYFPTQLAQPTNYFDNNNRSAGLLRTPLNLFKKTFLANAFLEAHDLGNVSSSPNSGMQQQRNKYRSSALLKLEIFLKIASELWLNVPIANFKLHSVPGTSSRLPSVLQIVIIRALVKHAHRFSYNALSFTLLDESSGSVRANSPSNQLNAKRLLVQQLLYRPLFGYLCTCFSTWPLDGSFRYALELWLSFIQPWRYQFEETQQDRFPMRDWNKVWLKFVADNYMVYAALFQLAINRFLRCDLASSRVAFLTYRLAKVFAPSLLELLEAVELEFASCGVLTSHGSLSFSAQRSFAVPGGWSASGSKPFPFNGNECRQLVKRLVEACQLALSQCELNIITYNASVATQAKEKTWLRRFLDFFVLSQTNEFAGFWEEAEWRKVADYMKFAIGSLSDAFSLPRPGAVGHIASAGSHITTYHQTANMLSSGAWDTSLSVPERCTATMAKADQPISNFIPDPKTGRLRLSPRGRLHFVNKSLQSQAGSSYRQVGCDYLSTGLISDLAPIRRDEIPFLTRMLFALAQSINVHLCVVFDRWYAECSFRGRLARCALEPPTRVLFARTPPLMRNPPDLPARLNLRYFARYQVVLGWLAFFAITSLCLHWSPFAAFALMIALNALLFVLSVAMCRDDDILINRSTSKCLSANDTLFSSY